jgi:hypothetical protein
MDNMYQGYRPDGAPTAPYSTNRDGGHRGGRGRLIAGIALASVLAGGAAFAAVTIVGNAPEAAGPTGQAALLNSALSSAATPATAASDTTAGPLHLLRDPLARLRLLGGMDGQFTFETKTGPRTLAFERGTIRSVAGGDVVVRAADGTTWAWELVSDSVVRENGQKTATGALSAGQLVFVGGPVVNGTRDARLVVIRTAPKTSTSGATSSGSTGASIS